MTEAEALRAEITFLTNEISGLKTRMASNANAVQVNKLEMLKRILSREERWLNALIKRGEAA